MLFEEIEQPVVKIRNISLLLALKASFLTAEPGQVLLEPLTRESSINVDSGPVGLKLAKTNRDSSSVALQTSKSRNLPLPQEIDPFRE